MNTKIIITKILFIAQIISLYIYIAGCAGSSSVTEPPFGPADCTMDMPLHKWKWQAFYMSSNYGNDFLLIDGFSFWNAYFYRCRVDMCDTFHREISYSIINSGNGSDTAIGRVLNDHYETFWDTLSTYRGYVCSIDSLSFDIDSTRVGLSRRGKWSYIMKGRIRNLVSSNNDTVNDFAEATLAHEIGHQIYISGHENHSGNDADRCIMFGMGYQTVYPYIIFCNGHACEIFNNTDSSGLFNNGYIASSKYILDSFTNNNFEVIILLDKEKYLEGEPIWLTVKIKNKSEQDIKLKNFLPFQNNAIKITNEYGDTSNYMGIISDYIGEIYQIIDENGEITYNIELLDNYGMIELGNVPSMYYYFPQGIYTVSFQYKTDSSNIRMYSNNLKFEIVKPEGVEATSWEELKEMCKPPSGYYTTMYGLRNFLYKYPRSIYTDLVFDAYIIKKTVNKEYEREIIDDCKFFINQRYNIGKIQYMGNVISTYFQAIKKYEGKETAVFNLNEIIFKYPESIASISAMNFLITLEKEDK